MSVYYDSLGEIVVEFAEDTLRPPERLTVSESAEKYRYLNIPGAYVGPWRNDTVPYMVEPMNVLTSREFDSMVFVGPAQAAKTEAWLNWVTHSVIVDPMDMILYEKSNVAARDFSHRRLDRLHKHTEAVRERLMNGDSSRGDNVYDKRYRSGMYLTLSWPSISELSGKPIPRVWFSDYDRMPQDVEGEGSPFDLGRKRTTTFGSNAMTVAESSPGFIVENPKWVRTSPHEAPPCKGVLALYNRGDRRRWNWKCPACGNWFEPDFSLMRYDKDNEDVMAAGAGAMMLCPNKQCGHYITREMKPVLNRAGRWLKDGQRLSRNDVLSGTPPRTPTASFWLKGVAAAFAPWSTLVARMMQAERDFAKTGEQQALKSVVNTDLGEPYYLRGSEQHRTADEMKEMADITADDGPYVPHWVRFLVATIDVQKNRFVVQIHGIGRRRNGFRVAVVDYYNIIKSHRLDTDDEHLWVKPAAYPEDWDELTTQVLRKRYRIEFEAAEMGIAFMGFDTGGRAGVTGNAYDYWRRCKKDPTIDHTRVWPMKGDNWPNAPRVTVSYPDSKRKGPKALSRGEVPVLMFNPTLLKDGLQGMIERAAEVSAGDEDDPTAGRAEGSRIERSFTWPDYLPESWYGEICAEIRTHKGWECPAGVRNEAWDLAYYCLGICLHLKVDRFVWDSKTLPAFARPFSSNPFVFKETPAVTGDETSAKHQNAAEVAAEEKDGYSALRKLASSLT